MNFKKILIKANNKIKENNDFFFKNRIIISIIMFIIILIALTLLSIFSTQNWIVAGGSTSIDPIMEKIVPWYKKNKHISIAYNSMGSAAAPTGVNKGYYQFGALSKYAPWNRENPGNYKYVPLLFAQDYFIIVFNLPSGATGNYNLPLLGIKDKKTNNNLGINIDNEEDLEKAMQAIYTSKNPTLNLINKTINKNKKENIFRGENLKKRLTLFTRESGSGTRKYMENDIINLPGSTNKASVETSNGAMMNAIKSTPCSVGYLSFSYMYEILKEIETEKLNLGVVLFNKELPYKIEKNGNLSFNKKYKKTRPFEAIINKKAKNLINVLEFWHDIMEVRYLREQIEQLGFQPEDIDFKKDGVDNEDFKNFYLEHLEKWVDEKKSNRLD